MLEPVLVTSGVTMLAAPLTPPTPVALPVASSTEPPCAPPPPAITITLPPVLLDPVAVPTGILKAPAVAPTPDDEDDENNILPPFAPLDMPHNKLTLPATPSVTPAPDANNKLPPVWPAPVVPPPFK